MFRVHVEGNTEKELATQLKRLASLFGGVELKNETTTTKVTGKKANAALDGDGEFNTDTDNETGDDEITDDTIIKAFATYAKETSRDKALSVLKKLGYKKPAAIPQDERAEVIEKLGV